MINKSELIYKIEELGLNLKRTDYKTLKYIEGGLSEEEFEAIKSERQSWRDEINRLKVLTNEQLIAEGLAYEYEEQPIPEPSETIEFIYNEIEREIEEGGNEDE